MKNKDVGCVILALSAFAGFVFPTFAKWILLVLVILGLVSWYGYEED